MNFDTQISSDDAYEACFRLITQQAMSLPSEDFIQLSTSMELLPYGDSSDPAMKDEWNKLWSATGTKSIAEALEISGQFILQEGDWGMGGGHAEKIGAALIDIAKRRDATSPLWTLWLNARSAQT